MSRRTRATTLNDNDSFKEKVEASARRKEAKVKQENAKKGKARRVESDEEAEVSSQPNGVEANEVDVDQDAEGEEPEASDGEAEERTPRGGKRARVNSVGASVPSSPNQVQRARVQTLPRDDDG